MRARRDLDQTLHPLSGSVATLSDCGTSRLVSAGLATTATANKQPINTKTAYKQNIINAALVGALTLPAAQFQLMSLTPAAWPDPIVSVSGSSYLVWLPR